MAAVDPISHQGTSTSFSCRLCQYSVLVPHGIWARKGKPGDISDLTMFPIPDMWTCQFVTAGQADELHRHIWLLMADFRQICAFSSCLNANMIAVQGTTLERCLAVTRNPILFNIYNTAAGLIPQHAGQAMHKDPIMYRARTCAQALRPEHAELTTNTDPAIDTFLTAVKHTVDMLEWLNHAANLSTGNLLQLSQLATALAHMDGYSDDLMSVTLIEARSQQDQCCDFLTFLGSHSAMQLEPVAQTAAELRTVVTLQDRATAEQIQQALTRSQALLSTPENKDFVRHFAARDSALFDAYLQQSWQHEIDILLQPGGERVCILHCCISLSQSRAYAVLWSAKCCKAVHVEELKLVTSAPAHQGNVMIVVPVYANVVIKSIFCLWACWLIASLTYAANVDYTQLVAVMQKMTTS